MTSPRIIIFSSWVLVFASAVATVVFVGGVSMTNSFLSNESIRLAELDSQYEALHARYLDLVFDRLGSEAKTAGFVALAGARYIEPRTVVGLAASYLPE